LIATAADRGSNAVVINFNAEDLKLQKMVQSTVQTFQYYGKINNY
jgi:hypothetical protein